MTLSAGTDGKGVLIMGISSLLLTVAGIVCMLIHYATHNIVLGIVTAVAFIAAYILGTVDMKRQSSKGGIRTDMFNPGMLGHGMAGTLVIVGGIMCLISNLM